MRLAITLATILALLSGLPARSTQSSVDINEAEPERQWKRYVSAVERSYSEREAREIAAWKSFEERVKKKWPDGAIPSQKVFVEYFADDTARVKIDYENGTVTAETLAPSNGTEGSAKVVIQNALKAIVNDDAKASNKIVNKNEISSDPVKPAQAIIADLMSAVQAGDAVKGSDGVTRQSFKTTLKMVPGHMKRRAERFRPIAEKWAKQFQLDPSYVLAIIRQESAFNPRARSWVPAYGLMQIVPKYAGKEVLREVTGQATLPDEDFLYDPEKNIMVGTTYLKILRDKYFPDVKDSEVQRHLMTASYNWGPHRIKTAIQKGRLSSRSPASEVFDRLQRIAPEETKQYLRRVVQYTEEFRSEK